MNKEMIRKMIQQEISRVKEDYLVPSEEVPDDFRRVSHDHDHDHDHSDQASCAACDSNPCACKSHSMKSLTCSSCGGPLVMEGGCGCGSSSYSTLFEPSMNYDLTPQQPDLAHEPKRGAYMAKSQLHKIEKYARELQQMIPEGTDLDDWMRRHISQAADDLSEVYHKLEYKSH